tara:strand:- start:136 stop:504 length:369 start_codon:yes stop_codon:yes gene_type:complete
MAFKSKGTLKLDLIEISKKQMGVNAYNNLDSDGKKKIDAYAEDMMGAIQAFIGRQEINITNLEAEGLIMPGEINTAGSPAAQANVNPVKILVQVSETSNKVGLPSVIQNVKKSAAKFLKLED